MSDFEWTDQDTAAAFVESLPDEHPSRFLDVVRTAAQMDDPRLSLLLPFYVTPESNLSWGDDFGVLIAYMRGDFRISTNPTYALDAPDVMCVRFVPDGGPWIVHDLREVEAVAHATLVWRNDLDAPYGETFWRLHAIGDPVHPAFVPRSPYPVDPKPFFAPER